MFSRYVFYKNEKGQRTLSVWSFVQSHEDYMKQHDILQMQNGTDWKNVISMGYLRLDLDKSKLCILPLLNKDERYVSHYLQQIKTEIEKLYPNTPKMNDVIRVDISVLQTQKKYER